MSSTSLEPSILKVGRDLRIRLPQPILQRVDWITGEGPVNGWLLLGSPGRCRLLPATEVENDPNIKSLVARTTAELSSAGTNTLEFHDEVSVALALRLMPVEIAYADTGWRIPLPRHIAAIMQIRPGESDLAALFFRGHIELWTIETLRSAVTPPLTEIL